MTRQRFLVIRTEAPRGLDIPPEDLAELVASFSTQELAEREVDRLTLLHAGEPCRFFWQEWTVETL
ncbi:MAG: hypothetical protein JNN07_24410 [Verrucomicrobiales bacterium]|nr:hypothetical protein [Verrucomicrobiales bacterium]